LLVKSHFEKGSQYLHDRQKPDYPAAANYFRKALGGNHSRVFSEMGKQQMRKIHNYQIINSHQLAFLEQKGFLGKTGNMIREYIDQNIFITFLFTTSSFTSRNIFARL
jgi:hypothetical protein